MGDLSGVRVGRDHSLPLPHISLVVHQNSSGIKFVTFNTVYSIPRAPNLKVCVFQAHEAAVWYRFGKIGGVRGPGVIFLNPLVDQMKCIDLRLRTYLRPIHCEPNRIGWTEAIRSQSKYAITRDGRKVIVDISFKYR